MLFKKIVLIGKVAVVGKVKTRLYPSLSLKEATEIYRILSFHICQIALRTSIPVEISFRGDLHSDFANALRDLGCTLFEQPTSTLGDIIHHALHRADRVLALGMDTPLIESQELIDALEHPSTVFGPAEDGGYWMIAASAPPQKLFESIDWSTNRVLSQSISRCKEANILYSLSQTHYDIDTAEDLQKLLVDPLTPPSLLQRIQKYA